MLKHRYLSEDVYHDAVREHPAGFVYTFDHHDMPNDAAVPSYGMLYCHPDHLPRLLPLLRDGPYILVMAGSDRTLDDKATRAIPRSVHFVFAVNTTTRDRRCVCLPIGLPSARRPGGSCSELDEVRSLNIDPVPGTLHCRFALKTHSSRPAAWEWARNSHWTLVGEPYEWYRRGPLGHKDFLIEMARCEAVLDPRGNGIDTHRRCEAFYLGRPAIRPFPIEQERAVHTTREEEMWAPYWCYRIHHAWWEIEGGNLDRGPAVASATLPEGT